MFSVLLLLLISPSTATAHSFRAFETTYLPEYVAAFRINGTDPVTQPGHYAFDVISKNKLSLYGTADVLLALAVTNSTTFHQLTEAQKDAWAATINSMQNETSGHWLVPVYENICGEQPWHASAYAVAALKLLGRAPAHPLQWADDFFASSTEWETVFTQLMNGSKTDNWWTTSHRAAAYPAVALMAGLRQTTAAPFFEWMYQWLGEQADPQSGYWCKNDKWAPPSHIALGGSFHLYEQYAADSSSSSSSHTWPYPERVLNSTLGLQSKGGLWDPIKGFTYCIDFDGVFTAARSALLLPPADQDKAMVRVRAACDLYLKRAALELNSELSTVYQAYSHLLPGALLAVAECQAHFPDLVDTTRPWDVTADRAPYM